MKLLTIRTLTAVALLGLTLPYNATASGSYAPRVPRRSAPAGAAEAAGATKAEQAQYALGQKVFLGKARLAKNVDGTSSTAQSPRLASLQAALPAAQAKAHDLTALAGRLTDAQLNGLETFVHKRFAGAVK